MFAGEIVWPSVAPGVGIFLSSILERIKLAAAGRRHRERPIAVEASGRHATACADPAVGIDAGGKAQFAGTRAVSIGPIHSFPLALICQPLGLRQRASNSGAMAWNESSCGQFALRRTDKPDCSGVASGVGESAQKLTLVNGLQAGAGEMSPYQQPIPAPRSRSFDRKPVGTASQGSARILPFKPRADHTAAIISLNPSLQRVGRGDQKKVRPRRLVVFKLPAYDPVAIAVMGFGIVFAVALALAF